MALRLAFRRCGRLSRTLLLSFFLFATLLAGCVASPDPLYSGGENPLEDESPVKRYEEDEAFEILADRVIQGSDKACLALADGSLLNSYENEERRWTPDPQADAALATLPRLSAPETPLLSALYRMTMEEALRDIRPDGAFMAGEKWPGVWTRDISYSIHLSLGLLMPEAAKKSLLAKTSPSRQVIQDTGTGGSWPISTDRVVWAIAAWEIYLATGEKEWLDTAYPILVETETKDRKTVFDPETGLYRGESSFTDWREQSYPRWMQPLDIYESKALSTNALHYELLRVLSRMARAQASTAHQAKGYEEKALALATAIRANFPVAGRSYLSAYRYGSDSGTMVTDKSDSLANSLAVIFDILPEGESRSLLEDLPVVHFGPPILYPQLQVPAYHNKAIWPFVTAYYGLAGQKIGNAAAFDFALGSNIRAAALFLTNKENFTFHTGHWRGTAVNSDRQLWSVAGLQAQVIKGIFGLSYDEKSLGLAPLVPSWIKGELELDGIAWRQARISVKLSGTGNRIAALKVNGKTMDSQWRLPASASGDYRIEIAMEGDMPGKIKLEPSSIIGPRDVIAINAERKADKVKLSWPSAGEGLSYRVYKDGRLVADKLLEGVYEESGLSSNPVYQIQSIDPQGVPSNLSQPYRLYLAEDRIEIEAEDGSWLGIDEPALHYGGYQGRGFIFIDKVTDGEMKLRIPRAGRYILRWRYSNGNGPINTDNKACVRSLYVNGKELGTAVFAQTAGWTRWAWSNPIFADLAEGELIIGLRYNPEDENMNGAVNQAALDCLELIRL